MSWLPASLMILAVALAFGFAWYERGRPSARVLALVGALAALAVVGRIAFAALPNVKPTTDIVLFSGVALGGAPGFAVGALAALVSNFFFGQGPWTPWQMAAWGGVGVMGAALARITRGREIGRVQLAIACAVAGVFFGMVMDLFQWTLGEPHTPAAYAAVSARSLGFNIAHVVGNVVFCLLIGPAFVRALRRYQRRFEVDWKIPRPATAVALVVALLMAASVSVPTGAEASSTSRAVDYLKRAQNRDGGFGAAPGQGSTQLHSGWVALGLSSAAKNPRAVSNGGDSLLDYLRGGARSLNDTGELERTILVLRSSGLNPRDWAGRDLIAELRQRRRSNGSYATINWTAFAVMALRASGVGGTGKSVSYLVKQQNKDGGWGFAPRVGSDADDTGAVLQALAAGGKRGSRAARRGLAYLKRTQHSDGGWGQMPSQPSNAQSTSWAVQGVVAMRRNPARFKKRRRSPLTFLRSLQRRDGSFRYSRRSAQTPVWVTAQALVALRRKAFPLKPAAVPRRVPRVAGDDAPRTSGGGASDASPSAPKRRSDSKRDKAGEEDASAGPSPGAGGPSAPPQAEPTLPAAEVLGGEGSERTADMTRAALVVVASALIICAVAWWRHRRRADPLA
jgi:energy-coupling factor transport system substrate-specific component